MLGENPLNQSADLSVARDEDIVGLLVNHRCYGFTRKMAIWRLWQLTLRRGFGTVCKEKFSQTL
nr:MAG TPA: hypothetical protein [Caudoviricetes sp.]